MNIPGDSQTHAAMILVLSYAVAVVALGVILIAWVVRERRRRR